MESQEAINLLKILAHGPSSKEPPAPMRKALDQMMVRLQSIWELHRDGELPEYIYAESEQDLKDILYNRYDKTDWARMRSVTRLIKRPWTANGESDTFLIATSTTLIVEPLK